MFDGKKPDERVHGSFQDGRGIPDRWQAQVTRIGPRERNRNVYAISHWVSLSLSSKKKVEKFFSFLTTTKKLGNNIWWCVTRSTSSMPSEAPHSCTREWFVSSTFSHRSPGEKMDTFSIWNQINKQINKQRRIREKYISRCWSKKSKCCLFFFFFFFCFFFFWLILLARRTEREKGKNESS